MSYSAIASLIRRGFPVENTSDSSVGSTWVYIGPTTDLQTNKPQIGETWADSRPVGDVSIHEISGPSDVSEMTVSTRVNASYSGTIGTAALEQTFYNLSWKPVQMPLEVHPEFLAGGTYELDATARKCIIGWRAEQDPALRAAKKFKPLDSRGNPGSEIDIATESPAASKFLDQILRGSEEWVNYLPIWRKRSIYKGANPPTGDAVGVKDDPGGTSPSGYEWVKSADNIERIGTTTRWRRDEEWEGCKTVYYDKTTIYV